MTDTETDTALTVIREALDSYATRAWPDTLSREVCVLNHLRDHGFAMALTGRRRISKPVPGVLQEILDSLG